MSAATETNRVHWSSRLTFILAAAGSAVGLGNIWKFPYIVGENGGGAFVLVYLACIAFVGIPVMMAEVLMGKRGDNSPVFASRNLAKESSMSPSWGWLGFLGVITGVIILSFYSVVAGWALAYLPKMVTGQFIGIDGAGSGRIFEQHLANPWALIGWHSLFMVMTMTVVVMGVTKGLGKAVGILMPTLFILLLVLLGFSIAEGEFIEAVKYLFVVDFSKLSIDAVLVALGHAFFTLSIGMGAIMAYGSYMPKDTPIAKTVILVGVLDTVVALVAGLAIFPIVFASPSIEPAQGPGLLFVSLPIAFGAIPAGVLFGFLFFALVSIAAWTSSISIIEPAVAWAVDTGRATRLRASLLLGGLCWLLGLGSALSFNLWSEEKLFNRFTWFDLSDSITTTVLLPLGGILISVFVSHLMKKRFVEEEMGLTGRAFNFWYFTLRWVSPILVSIIFCAGLYNTFS